MNLPTVRKKKELGAIWLHRSLRQSAIWEVPAEYLKVWIHILLSVPYSGDRAGQKAFYFSREDCPGVSPDQWVRAIAWLRKKGSITTIKIRHGQVIQVAKFAQYQQLNKPTKQATFENAPLMAMWQETTGGVMTDRNASILVKLIASRGIDQTTLALKNYLAGTDGKFASIARLEETFGSWLTAQSKKPGPAPRGRAAISGHKGATDYDAIDPTQA